MLEKKKNHHTTIYDLAWPIWSTPPLPLDYCHGRDISGCCTTNFAMINDETCTQVLTLSQF